MVVVVRVLLAVAVRVLLVVVVSFLFVVVFASFPSETYTASLRHHCDIVYVLMCCSIRDGRILIFCWIPDSDVRRLKSSQIRM